MNAQEREFMLGVRGGYNAAFGGFGAVSLETTQAIGKNFSINGGLQYNTIGKTSLEARPAYDIPFEWGKLSVESILTYNRLTSINNFTAGLGAAVDYRFISAKLGYYYRLYGGNGDTISEPFNLYYELCAHCLKNIEKWDFNLAITNCEIFDLERHYQPSFIAEGRYYPTSKLGIAFGIGYKPSGMFHISADYYQTYLKTGLCYRW
jgi:hypothetical protein